MHIVGIDVGGTGIKGAIVDTTTGQLLTERTRIDTPVSRSPADVINTLADLIDLIKPEQNTPLGVGLPLVVVNNVPCSAFSAYSVKGWKDQPVGERMRQQLGVPVTLINDADAAGLAEAKFGAGKDKSGLVIVLTFGTGVGSGMFYNGQLIPNTEFGKLYMRHDKKVCEYRVAASARKRDGLDWEQFAPRMNKYLAHIETLFTPQLLIIGGSASKKFDKYSALLTTKAPIVPAELLNNAGIIGAAMAATIANPPSNSTTTG